MSTNYNNPTKQQMVDFIMANFETTPQDDLTTLRGIKNVLEKLIKFREDRLIQQGIDSDDFFDDDVYGEATEFLGYLNENRINNELENIQNTQNVSLATKNKVPGEITDKIGSYIVNTPENQSQMFETIKRFGGKQKKSKRKVRRSKKSRRSKRKTRSSKRKTRSSRRYARKKQRGG